MDTYTVEQAIVPEATSGDKRSRRLRSVEEKTRIVKEALVPNASVAEVARRHGVNANLLFNWRRLYQQGLLESHTRPPKATKLLPVKVAAPAATPAPASSSGTIEIEWPDKVRVRVAGDVSTSQLSAVLQALAQRR